MKVINYIFLKKSIKLEWDVASSNCPLLYQTPSEVARRDSKKMGYRGLKAMRQSRLEMSHPNFTQSEFHPCGLLPHPRSGLTTVCISQQHPCPSMLFHKYQV